MQRNKRTSTYVIAALLALIAAFHLFVPIAEHGKWNDDANMFILHARNITEGAPYAEMHFIPNPHMKTTPRYFPPVFPLIISPIYRTMGMDRAAM